jgi:Siphovirus ReqiPepy6 Gp37-like protein
VTVSLTDFFLVVADGTTALGQVTTYESLTITARLNDVSSWELTLPTQTEAARLFLDAQRPRLIIRDGTGNVFRSGPRIRVEREVDEEGDTLTIYGVDDLIWLARRMAHPEPGTAVPPYDDQAYDTRSGPSSQVIAAYVDANAGPAAVPARRVPGLTVPVPAPLGPTVKTSARYQNLLELVSRMANRAALGIEVRDLVFIVYEPTPAVAVFSEGLGTLGSWSHAEEAPLINHVYVAGGGAGRHRLIREYSDAASVERWGRFEGFEDKRDTTDPLEMDEAGAEVLAEIPTDELELQAVDTTSQAYGTDWNLGDQARVTVDGQVFTDVIREVTITAEANRPTTVVPTIGGAK